MKLDRGGPISLHMAYRFSTGEAACWPGSGPIVCPMVKRVLKWVALVLAVVLVGAGCVVAFSVRAYSQSMAKVYDVPLPAITRSTDPAVIARGKHVAESIAGCAGGDCHGLDLAGAKPLEMGPLGTITAPNITPAPHGKDYS